MKRTLFLLIIVIMTACAQINPFLKEWDTPYGIPPFSEIDESDYIRAIKFGIRQQQRQIDHIIADSSVPTFENTVEAYELSGSILDKVGGVLFNLSESDATPSLQRIVERFCRCFRSIRTIFS